ncbi:hypothetical protein IQE94_18315 (plasmid) [Synechocystis sp. PCC 7339]|uniref:hypothetical protein n=1 Tax=Synechocystis sp. PCC 7339 TaxID=2782213 RepID=UPI001CBA6DA4|nr:hypothetical protein [Synechocystis sp. PCC 7339]UAJ74678.1 hypothetical protein IQE94_18315 [Synechocystis sp. PCC 7339]
MNSSATPRQPVSSCRKGDLLDAQDFISEIAKHQLLLEIIETLQIEASLQLDPRVSLLLCCYHAAGIPAKLQAATDLIESVRKSLP